MHVINMTQRSKKDKKKDKKKDNLRKSRQSEPDARLQKTVDRPENKSMGSTPKDEPTIESYTAEKQAHVDKMLKTWQPDCTKIMSMVKHAYSVKAESKTQNAQENYALHAVIRQGYRTPSVLPAMSQERFEQKKFVMIYSHLSLSNKN